MAVCIVLTGPFACATSEPPDESSMSEIKPQPLDDATREALRRVANTRVFFAHQSVGQNMLSGLERLLEEAELEWPIVKSGSAAPSERPLLLQDTPGLNGNPRSKIDGFAAAVNDLTDPKPKLAFMKLCYVDITPDTNVDELFAHYRETLSALQKDHGDITFGHVTVPLTVYTHGMKERVYRSIGRRVWADASNIKRHEYNQRLREAFRTAPILDLALVESTYPDGRREKFEAEGTTAYSLIPGYASDDGHLNEVGQRRAAAELVRFIDRVGSS